MSGAWEHQIQTARNILDSFLQTHSLSLNDESLRTLMNEVELIVSSKPLIVGTLNDTNSSTPIPASNLLTLK